jgi:HSP90 family molecular chaperone
MRDYISNSNVATSVDNILSFKHQSHSAKNPGAAVLDLVYQAADLIGGIDNYAAERQARAEALARQAIEKLKIADDHVRSAEAARRASEAEIEQFSDRVEKEVSIKVQEIEKAIEQMASGMAATEARLSAAEQRARNAEMRADEAENSLKLIERAIRTRILEKRFDGSSGRVATAA